MDLLRETVAGGVPDLKRLDYMGFARKEAVYIF
jgi:hypothetical protein